MTCHVYVIGADDGTGPWKIGLSTNIKDRLNSLQSGSPVLLAVKCAYSLSDIANAQKVERFAHGILAPHRAHGEWFSAELAQVVDAVSKSACLLDGTPMAPVSPRPKKPRPALDPNPANKPRYARWRDKNPELYKARQADYMRKRRAADKAKKRAKEREE